MSLRTKLLATWGALVILLWAGTLWAVQRSNAATFARVANDAFNGTRRSMGAVQAERLRRMRQACWLVMNIPELRALIAEANYEVSVENVESLTERLDALTHMMGASFLCVLDNRGNLIAQNHDSPWPTLDGLRAHLARSPQAADLVRHVFATPGSGEERDTYALWADERQLYDVVGAPLVFRGGDDASPAAVDGALIIATPITDDLAAELSTSHNCEITFLSGKSAAASSLAGARRNELERRYASSRWPVGQAFETTLDGVAHRSWLEMLRDPCSGEVVGAMLVQSSLADLKSVQSGALRALLVILLSGLGAVALGAYMLSGAVTRPLADLVAGVRKVAEGDLDLALHAARRDELGQLAAAFNDMVSQLRSRRELQRLVEESQAASRAKSQFLATMSHEIRTPLNGVIGMSQLLLATRLDERQRRYAGLVKTSAEVLTTLINDVLDFSKIEAGKLELESIPFSPHVVVEDVVEIMAPKAYAKGLEIACDIGADLPTMVTGDPNRIRQVLINLLSNAIKFTDRGEVLVRAALQPGEENRLIVRFSVTDTGIGIPRDRRDRLFKSFSQVDASTTRKYGGTGLGLAISKQLAEAMGGAIGVESEPGQGSTFWFSAALGVCPSEREQGVAAPTDLVGLRVLVADPHAASVEILIRRLREWGVQAESLPEGNSIAQALDDAGRAGRPFVAAFIAEETLGPDALANGWTVDAAAGRGTIRVWLLLKTDRQLSVERLRRAGFNGYLTKPLRRAQLIDVLLGEANPEAQPGPEQAENALHAISATKPVALKHAQVLLAEDNEVNQLIVKDMLANAGYRCDVVSDGARAVEAVARGRYDLILMDCQMPEMDGFEATRTIRDAESAAGTPGGRARLPIIALTADAVSGDRQRCLDAGMDAYCTKPIDAERLIDAIESLLPADRREFVSRAATPKALAREEASEQAPAPQSPPPLDFEALMRRCSGKASLAGRVLETLASQAAESVESMQACLASNDAQGLASAAHALKGAAGMAAADMLHLAAARLEDLGRAGEFASAQQRFEELRDEVRRCDAFIRNALQTPDAVKRPSANATE